MEEVQSQQAVDPAIIKRFNEQMAALDRMTPEELRETNRKFLYDLQFGNTPVFEVFDRNEKTWKIYAVGRIEGFPPDCYIINRVPTLLHAFEASIREK